MTTKPVGIGTGLGLSICQRLVTAMGGSIWAESAPGKGTVFHVALQAAPGAAAAAAATENAASEPARPVGARILVVDDEDMIGMILRRVLKAHDVSVMTNATDALSLIAGGKRYDAILCDVMMPGMTGIDFYGALLAPLPRSGARLDVRDRRRVQQGDGGVPRFGPQRPTAQTVRCVKLRSDVDAHLIASRAGSRPPGHAA